MENASKALIIAGAILISILLITVGIILIRSGQDITSTGASQMASQNIQTFNAQFTSYQGKIKGSQVKNLLSQVRANNTTDKSHLIIVYSSIAENNISSTKDYNVTLHYNGEGAALTGTSILGGTTITSESGYIDSISIQ